MKRSSARAAPIAAAILSALVLASACKKQAPATAAPADAQGAYGGADATGEEPATSEDLASLESELARIEAELVEAGAGPDAQPQSSDPVEAEARCRRICELSALACELETRICTLADEHTGEDRYASACTRATGQCERASEACRVCAE